jgi:hypothetical protein
MPMKNVNESSGIGIGGPRPDEFYKFGAKRFESLMGMQKELVETFQRLQQERLKRATEETELMSEFAQKVLGARSIPDVMALYQEWIAQHMELLTQDGRNFLDESQKITNATLRLLSNADESGDVLKDQP